MKKIEKQKENNIIIIGSRDKTEMYISMIVNRMNPAIYNEYKNIKIQVKTNLLEFADAVINRMKWAGLDEVKREKKPITAIPIDGASYTLDDAYEITLEMIPILQARAEEWDG